MAQIIKKSGDAWDFSTSEIIPTRQIQIYGGVFEVVLQEKLSQIC